MSKWNNKKTAQLGMPLGTANNRLRKAIIFAFLKKLNENYCYRCGKEIVEIAELSIEHKEAWLDSENPVKKFFDLANISFSHLACNVAERRHKEAQHGLYSTYNNSGCRCDQCTEAGRVRKQQQRDKWKKGTECNDLLNSITLNEK